MRWHQAVPLLLFSLSGAVAVSFDAQNHRDAGFQFNPGSAIQPQGQPRDAADQSYGSARHVLRQGPARLQGWMAPQDGDNPQAINAGDTFPTIGAYIPKGAPQPIIPHLHQRRDASPVIGGAYIPEGSRQPLLPRSVHARDDDAGVISLDRRDPFIGALIALARVGVQAGIRAGARAGGRAGGKIHKATHRAGRKGGMQNNNNNNNNNNQQQRQRRRR